MPESQNAPHSKFKALMLNLGYTLCYTLAYWRTQMRPPFQKLFQMQG
jgi:hypothetical protein